MNSKEKSTRETTSAKRNVMRKDKIYLHSELKKNSQHKNVCPPESKYIVTLKTKPLISKNSNYSDIVYFMRFKFKVWFSRVNNNSML